MLLTCGLSCNDSLMLITGETTCYWHAVCPATEIEWSHIFCFGFHPCHSHVMCSWQDLWCVHAWIACFDGVWDHCAVLEPEVQITHPRIETCFAWDELSRVWVWEVATSSIKWMR